MCAAFGAAVVGSIFQLSLHYFAAFDQLIQLQKVFSLSLSFNVMVILLAYFLLTRLLKSQA